MATADISKVLNSDQTTSRDFGVPSKSVVRLEGTVNGVWDVESRRKDGTEWISETEATFLVGSKPDATIKQVVVEGNPNLVYRIVLGSTNEGPEGFVYPIGVEVHE